VLHHTFADERRGDFLIEVAKYIFLDPVCDLLDLLHRDCPFVASFLQTSDDFFTVVRNPGLILFGDVKLEAFADLLVGGEAPFASKALSATPDHPACVT
jgi:hypothetical protein